MAFCSVKKNKKWIIKAVDRSTGRTIVWVIGGRDATTFRRLYEKVKHLTGCKFYTDHWDAFAEILPKEQHVVGKSGTVTIERDNSSTRHHLGRMARRTKVVSKKEYMVDASLKLWRTLTEPLIFAKYQQKFLSIFE
jgi:insertion element IS1 protein InsB